MPRIWISIGLCIAIVAVGAGLILLTALRRNAPEQAVEASESDAAARVRVEELEPVRVEDRLRLTGSLHAWEERTISAEVGGVVEAQQVEEGDSVRAGQELFRIDTRALDAQLAEARAQLRLADQELDRLERLVERGAGTAQELDQARASQAVAAAQVRRLQIQLEKSVVRAPFDGVVDALYVEESEFTDVGAPLIRLVQVERLKFMAGLPERDVRHFEEGDAVAVTLDSLPGRRFDGVITKIATTAHPETLTFRVEVALDNPDGELRPGMIARGNFVRAVYDDTVTIPIFSTFAEEDGRYVFVEENGVARIRPIVPGVVQGQRVQVVEGLEPGDRVVVVGQRQIREGQPLEAVTEAG